MPSSAPLREQLRLLRESSDAGSLLKMLPRFAAQRATIFLREIGPQPNPSPSVVADSGDPAAVLFFGDDDGAGCCCCGSFCSVGEGGAEPVRDVQEARGVNRVQVPVRVDALRVPPVPGEARVRVRFQGIGEGADREGEPGGEG